MASSLAKHASDPKHKGWVAVDFDGTLAHHTKWKGSDHAGDPIKPMVDRVKRWVASGKDVRIFTARAHDPVGVKTVKQFCLEHIGKELPVTATKDQHTVEIWDDRAVQVVQNTGERADGRGSFAKRAADAQPGWKVKLADARVKIAAAKNASEAVEIVSGEKLAAYLRKRAKLLTKTQARYVDTSPFPEKTCSGCEFFVGGERCKKVAGLLKVGGWCKHFKSKEKS